MRLRVHPAAAEETMEAAAWYDRRSTGLGLEFLAAVDGAIQRLRLEPERFPYWDGVPLVDPPHRAAVERFPFSVLFDVVKEEIIILAVAHAKRRPGYWAPRR